MIKSSELYGEAVVGTARRTHVKAIVDIIDPDITFGSISATSEASGYSRRDEVIDREFYGGDKYITLEFNRTLLGGDFRAIPDDPSEEVGYISDELCGLDGVFAAPQSVTVNFGSVEILQNATIAFPTSSENGVASAFTVEVLVGSTVSHTASFAGNTAAIVVVSDFTVSNPTALRVTVTKWSLPSRRARIIEIFPGLHEEWSGRDIAALSVTQQTNFASVALPYGTCIVTVDNHDRRFEPSVKNSIFKSIEDGQGMQINIGVSLPSGEVEYKSLGRYYQYDGGWKTGNNGLTIQWSLVDIVGLLANREFIPPTSLPTTVEGWIATIVAQLGTAFETEYIVDADIAEMEMVAATRDSVTGQNCGNIIMWVAQASGTWAHADAASGKFALRKLADEGTRLTLANLESYPTTQANTDAAAVIFTLADTSSTQVVVYGDNQASSNTVSVQNPFIALSAEAKASGAFILGFYGGNAYNSVGRGNPASELGDVDEIEVTPGNFARGRRISQTFAFSEGVLRGCQSSHIEVKDD